MSTRVNLLQAEEIRQQASLSREALLRIAGAAGAVLAAAGLAWAIWQFIDVSRRHAEVSRAWAAVRADYESAQVVQEEVQAKQGYLGELEGWRSSRVIWHGPFDELREIVPANMQLTRLSVNGQITAPAPNKAAGGGPALLHRRYALHLEGLAEGQLSDQDVIRFVENLRAGRTFSSWLESVKLQGLQRHGGLRNPTEEAARTFRVDAISKERPFQ